jgi:hypothetical protein
VAGGNAAAVGITKGGRVWLMILLASGDGSKEGTKLTDVFVS